MVFLRAVRGDFGKTCEWTDNWHGQTIDIQSKGTYQGNYQQKRNGYGEFTSFDGKTIKKGWWKNSVFEDGKEYN